MSQILDLALVQPPAGLTEPMPLQAWLILDCGHWYKWTGKVLPKIDNREQPFPCPECAAPIQVVSMPPGETPDRGK